VCSEGRVRSVEDYRRAGAVEHALDIGHITGSTKESVKRSAFGGGAAVTTVTKAITTTGRSAHVLMLPHRGRRLPVRKKNGVGFGGCPR